MSIIVLAIVIMLWIFYINKKDIQALTFLLNATVIYYNQFINKIEIDFIIKVLFLLTFIIYSIRFGARVKVLKIVIPLILVMYFCSLIDAQWSYNYTFIASITAFSSFFTGIYATCIYWEKSHAINLLVTLSRLAIVSLILGIPLATIGFVEYLGRFGTAIAGASLSTNLAFFGTIGVMASAILYNLQKNDKYRFLQYVNFVIVCATLTRGGIIASFLILIPDILKILKEMFYKSKYLIIVFFTVVIATYPAFILVKSLLKRTFVEGELNTSGRIEAWKHIITLVNNKWFGNGYGCLKTLTDDIHLRAFTAAHNEYIRIYFETGIVGLIIIGIVIIYLFRVGIKNRITSRKIYIYMLYLAFLVYSFFDNCITNFRFWIPFMIIISILGTYRKRIKLKL